MFSPDSLKLLQVLKLSQYQLLQTASPDAIVRLQRTNLARECEQLQQIYFGQQHHSSLNRFLAHHLKRDGDAQSGGLLLQVCQCTCDHNTLKSIYKGICLSALVESLRNDNVH